MKRRLLTRSLPFGLMCGAIYVLLATWAAHCAPTSRPSVTVSGVTVVAETLVCGLKTYAADTSTTPPASWEQIALDLATNCGMDVAQTVALFGEKHPVSMAALRKPAADSGRD